MVGGSVALYCNSENCKSYFSNNYFNQNRGEKGGVIYQHSGKSKLSMSDNTFYQNQAREGSVLNTNAHANLFKNQFIKNSATNGGCIFTEAGADLLVNQNYFKENIAENGGVIKINSRQINIVFNHFIQNQAQYGSSIYFSEIPCYNCSKNITLLYQNYFSSNIAVLDGTVYLSPNSFVRSVLNRFTDNKGGRGGIYYADIGSELLVLSENATNNQADFGSILYFRGDKIKVSDSYYYKNTVRYSGGVFYISRESKNNIQFFRK